MCIGIECLIWSDEPHTCITEDQAYMDENFETCIHHETAFDCEVCPPVKANILV